MSDARPEFIPDFILRALDPAGLTRTFPGKGPSFCDFIFDDLQREVPWITVGESPRSECFMALDQALRYSYGSQARGRVYDATPMHPHVQEIMAEINRLLGCRYNACVLNRYTDRHQWLGWHRDDSPEQDVHHPIAVMSFGAVRAIEVRPNGRKGATPPEDRFLLTPGSLFIMPAGYQDTHQHKIPKHDRECGPRISLTFRKLDRSFIPSDPAVATP